ncbi:hypothetical protein Nmel_013906 [Mimus melanotis]
MVWCSAGTCCPALAPGGTTATPVPTAWHPDGACCLPCIACLPPSCWKPGLSQTHGSCQAKGPQVGARVRLYPPQLGGTGCGTGRMGLALHCGTRCAPQALEEVLEEGPAVTEDTLLPPPVYPWAVWGLPGVGMGQCCPLHT